MGKRKIEKIAYEIINRIDNIRTDLSDEFYPDNLHTLEVLREEIEEILIRNQ